MTHVSKFFQLDSSLAVITGGAGLLGRKHVEALLESKASVVVLDVNQEGLNTLKKDFDSYGEKLLVLKADITRETDLLRAKDVIFEQFTQYPDILINNAAIDPKYENDRKVATTRLENFSLDQWNLELSVGLTGAFLCSKIFGKEMANQEKGVILNVSSDLGLISPDQRLYQVEGLDPSLQPVKPITYSVIKHALIGLTKYLATYWSDSGVRCNAFAPGGVYNKHSKEFLDRLTPLIPLKRMADVDEYKATIVYMCSNASSYMNGSTLVMDGGRSIL